MSKPKCTYRLVEVKGEPLIPWQWHVDIEGQEDRSTYAAGFPTKEAALLWATLVQLGERNNEEVIDPDDGRGTYIGLRRDD